MPENLLCQNAVSTPTSLRAKVCAPTTNKHK